MAENQNGKLMTSKNMKCHFIYHEGQKVWIPGCGVGIYSEPFCSCREHEKELFKKLKEDDPGYQARKENKELWKENAALHRIIKRLTSNVK